MYEELIRGVVDSYKNLSKISCASFSLVTEDGAKHETTLSYVCHAPLQYAKKGYDHIFTSYPVKDDLDLRFFDFMKNTMYREWSDYICLEKTMDDQHYIHVSSLDKIPANVLYNFCICSRIPIERKKCVKVWDKLCSEGIHPTVALGLCRSDVRINDSNFMDQFICDTCVDNGHWPFYTTSSIHALVNGPLESKQSTASFKSKPNDCTPTNIIWGDDCDFKGLEGSTIRKFWEDWKEKLA